MRVEVEDYDLDKLRQFVRSFPFAAVLPVQPLMMLPTETGVDVVFRYLARSTRAHPPGCARAYPCTYT